MRPAWVVLDLGETLVDETRQWTAWAEHLEVPVLTLFAALGGVIARRRPHTDAVALVRPDTGFAAEQARKDAAGRPWHLDASDLYPDALPALAALRGAGYRTAVMANQPLEAQPFLATLPVDAVAASAAWGVSKPDPAFFARVCAELGAAPHEIAYVGDRVDNDVLPARAAGMTAVHLRRGPWGVVHDGWPEAARAHLRLSGLDELVPALGG